MRKGRKTNSTTGAEESDQILTGCADMNNDVTSDTERERDLNPPLSYSIDEACRLTSLGRTTLYKAIKSGSLVAAKFGRRTFISHENLMKFVRGCQNTDAALGRLPASPFHP
jgi:excisionase family DNA binding protein